MTLGQKIRSARIEKGWKQLDLANAINSKVPVISRWETDQRKPRIDKLPELAKALDVPIAYLIDDKAGYTASDVVNELREIKELLKKLAEKERI